MRKNASKQSPLEGRKNVMMNYALMLLVSGKEKVAERYKDREKMTSEEIRWAKEESNRIKKIQEDKILRRVK